MRWLSLPLHALPPADHALCPPHVAGPLPAGRPRCESAQGAPLVSEARGTAAAVHVLQETLALQDEVTLTLNAAVV